MATGWLFMDPEVAERTPIPYIFTTLKFRKEWMMMCNGQVQQSPADRIKERLLSFEAQFKKVKAGG